MWHKGRLQKERKRQIHLNGFVCCTYKPGRKPVSLYWWKLVFEKWSLVCCWNTHFDHQRLKCTSTYVLGSTNSSTFFYHGSLHSKHEVYAAKLYQLNHLRENMHVFSYFRLQNGRKFRNLELRKLSLTKPYLSGVIDTGEETFTS